MLEVIVNMIAWSSNWPKGWRASSESSYAAWTSLIMSYNWIHQSRELKKWNFKKHLWRIDRKLQNSSTKVKPKKKKKMARSNDETQENDDTLQPFLLNGKFLCMIHLYLIHSLFNILLLRPLNSSRNVSCNRIYMLQRNGNDFHGEISSFLGGSAMLLLRVHSLL